jgi:hypothetical protein
LQVMQSCEAAAAADWVLLDADCLRQLPVLKYP